MMSRARIPPSEIHEVGESREALTATIASHVGKTSLNIYTYGWRASTLRIRSRTIVGQGKEMVTSFYI